MNVTKTEIIVARKPRNAQVGWVRINEYRKPLKTTTNSPNVILTPSIMSSFLSVPVFSISFVYLQSILKYHASS